VITNTSFVQEYPEFASIPGSAIANQITRLTLQINQEVFTDELFDIALSLLVAHRLSLRFNISCGVNSNGMRSPLTSVQTVNNRSASPDSLSESSVTSGLITGDNAFMADLARTEYGLEFLNLIQTQVSPVTLFK
jgi:hypothetical protein